jgi:hypothetical protein
MTLFRRREGRLHDHSSTANRLRRVARRAIGRTGAGFRAIHRTIVIAKMRRIQRELMFHEIPQRPLILPDKWDF